MALFTPLYFYLAFFKYKPTKLLYFLQKKDCFFLHSLLIYFYNHWLCSWSFTGTIISGNFPNMAEEVGAML